MLRILRMFSQRIIAKKFHLKYAKNTFEMEEKNDQKNKFFISTFLSSTVRCNERTHPLFEIIAYPTLITKYFF